MEKKGRRELRKERESDTCRLGDKRYICSVVRAFENFTVNELLFSKTP